MRPILLLPFFFLLLSFPAAADHNVGRCGGGDGPSFGVIQVGAGTAEATFYIDDRNFLLGNGIWLYAESNGVFHPHPLPEPSVPPIQYWYQWAYPWIYRYGDAHANLQRGGEAFWSSSTLPEQYRDREICTDVGEWTPDTLIY